MKKVNSDYTFKYGLKNGLPIGLGYLSVSFAFGVQASLLGIPALIALFTSMTNMTSAGQLAGLEIMAALNSASNLLNLILMMVLTQLVINARYFLMSVSLTQKLDESFNLPQRFLCSFAVTDEIYALAVAKPKPIGTKYFYGLALLPYLCWALGTILGALAGDILPKEISSSLGIALYAMFIAIIIPPATKSLGVTFTILIAAGISCLFTFVPALSVVQKGIVYVISAVVAAVAMAIVFPVKMPSDDDDEEITPINNNESAAVESELPSKEAQDE